jgi:CheY-like chemotaxis protein
MLDICLAITSLGVLVEPNHQPTKAEAILLVDDDDLYVRAMTRQLRGLGYPYVFRATSAAEALDMLQRVRPTVVLTDMVMEHREAGQWVIAAANQLGISVAVVSGMPGLEEASLGHPIVRKSDLDAAKLEELVHRLVAENRSQHRSSTFPALPTPQRSQYVALKIA